MEIDHWDKLLEQASDIEPIGQVSFVPSIKDANGNKKFGEQQIVGFVFTRQGRDYGVIGWQRELPKFSEGVTVLELYKFE